MNASIAQNVVERVAEELQKHQPSLILPAAVIRAASEKYRLLAIQVRVGTIQLQPASQKDTAERRAAALLEHCTRQYQPKDSCDGDEKQFPILHLSWSALAASVHAKSPDPIQQLQHILINFLQPASFTKAVNRKPLKLTADTFKNDQSLQNNPPIRNRIYSKSHKDGTTKSNDTGTNATSQRRTGSTSETQYAPKILQELVIRLAGHLLDPHGIQKVTTQLLDDIYAHYEVDTKGGNNDSSRYINVAERRGHLYDLQRYGAAYEAAALYHVATSTYENNQQSTHVDMEKARKGKTQRLTRKSKDEALNLEDDDTLNGTQGEVEGYLPSKGSITYRSLQIDDLMDASNEYTYLEIMQVLPRVQALAKKLNEAGSNLTTNSVKKRPRKSRVRTSKDTNRKEPAKAIDAEVSERKSTKHVDSQTQPSYVEWKENVLSEAKAESRRNISANNTANDHQAITLSANFVLQKYGISSL